MKTISDINREQAALYRRERDLVLGLRQLTPQDIQSTRLTSKRWMFAQLASLVRRLRSPCQ